MKKLIVVLIILWILVGAYGYIQNPAACKKLMSDLMVDIPAVYTPTDATKEAFSNAVSTRGASLLKWVKGGGPTNAASATPPGEETNSAASMSPAAASSPQATPAPTSPAPAPAATAQNPAAPAEPMLPPATPAQQAALAAWQGPASIPSQAGWTWTTSKGTFTDVQITRVEADAVTIIHHDGGALVSISELPADLQKQLNYNPDAAAAATVERQKEDMASEQAIATEHGQLPVRAAAQAPVQAAAEATDYLAALAQAKSSGKLVMLHFTGSDWCPYCKMLDSEVLATPTFGTFANPKYVFLTVDFPRSTPQTDAVKQQNQALAQKFSVNGYPTLVVVDPSEKEVGRISGYDPGSGPDAVIAQLKAFTH